MTFAPDDYELFPAAYDTPFPFADVFQPANVYPTRANEPEFEEMAVADPPVVKLPFAGVVPDVAPFAS